MSVHRIRFVVIRRRSRGLRLVSLAAESVSNLGVCWWGYGVLAFPRGPNTDHLGEDANELVCARNAKANLPLLWRLANSIESTNDDEATSRSRNRSGGSILTDLVDLCI